MPKALKGCRGHGVWWNVARLTAPPMQSITNSSHRDSGQGALFPSHSFPELHGTTQSSLSLEHLLEICQGTRILGLTEPEERLFANCQIRVCVGHVNQL